jgi:RNA polymerase sigma-70 factor (ECF subfamily)
VGTSEAFEALCRSEYDGLVRTAFLICGDAAEARDLAQETLARAFERWRTVSRHDRPGAWCRKVVVNLALSSRRRRARATRLPFQQDAVWLDEPMDDALVAALRALGDQQRAVVVLRYLCDLSIAETAQILGKRESTVRSISSQATDRLRAALTPTEEPIDGTSPKERTA